MEAMLGISLYSYLYLKLTKTLCLSYYLLCFLFNKIGQEGKTSSAQKGGEGSGPNNYTRVSKCKNNKRKKEKKNKQTSVVDAMPLVQPASKTLT
jgi:hypothetical protein